MQNINSFVFLQLAAVIYVGREWAIQERASFSSVLVWFADAYSNKLNLLLPPSQELVTKAEIK